MVDEVDRARSVWAWEWRAKSDEAPESLGKNRTALESPLVKGTALWEQCRGMGDTAREQLKEILLKKSVRTGEFTLASGKTSDLYIDCRVTTMDPAGALLVGEVGWTAASQYIEEKGLEVDCIGGMTLGADPVSLAVGMESVRQSPENSLQVFTVRKEPKGHGRGKQIEGNFKEGDTLIVVDDVITTGGSTLKAIDAIEAAGGKIAFALVLVDREEGGRQAIEARGIPVLPLFTRTSLLGS